MTPHLPGKGRAGQSLVVCKFCTGNFKFTLLFIFCCAGVFSNKEASKIVVIQLNIMQIFGI